MSREMSSLIYFMFVIFHSVLSDNYHPDDDTYMHKTLRIRNKRSIFMAPVGEDTASYWNNYAQVLLKNALEKPYIQAQAKNVILFLGDGMSIPTLGATRVYEGQRVGRSGEENYLSFEKLPFVGLSKTYCVDSQVADSACSATAYLGGVKANSGTIGVTAAVNKKDCKAMLNSTNHVHSIAHWAQLAGKSTGVVTTTRITHASPAGVYAHTAFRDWECDTDIIKSSEDPKLCPDIASQLIYGDVGRKLNVILGGGRKKLLPKEIVDEEGAPGTRSDGQNLIKMWESMKTENGEHAKYVWNREQLLNSSEYDYLLGLFESDHCQYHIEANHTTEPTLTEMTAAAIKILSKNPEGYFLFVEGGRIDHAHHDTNSIKALDETVEFSLAVEEARKLTNQEDTLIVVTSDHAHTMSYGGYPERGNDILGMAGMSDIDGKPYSTLSYANGPGYKHPTENGDRYDITNDPMGTISYKFPSLAPKLSETHGGDDVGIFASGPWAHLMSGVHEQNLIPHIMEFASCLGNGITYCDTMHH